MCISVVACTINKILFNEEGDTMKVKTSMQDIADHLGISKNSVSLALRDKPGVTAELKDKVKKAAIELKYSGYLDFQYQNNSKVVLIVPEYVYWDTGFYQKVLLGVEQYGTQKGYHVVLRSLSKQQINDNLMPEMISDSKIGGFIIVGNLPQEYMAMLKTHNLPIVAIDNQYPGLETDCVMTDNLGGAFNAVNYLIDRGHKSIGFLGPILIADSFFERWCGYQKAMRTAGLEINSDTIFTEYAKNHDELLNIENMEKALENLTEYPSAFFCANDTVALSLMKILNKKGLNVPGDISVVGFDNMDYLDIVVPGLTTVNIHRKSMGHRAMDLIISKMNKNESFPVIIKIYTDIVERESVKKV